MLSLYFRNTPKESQTFIVFFCSDDVVVQVTDLRDMTLGQTPLAWDVPQSLASDLRIRWLWLVIFGMFYSLCHYVKRRGELQEKIVP